MSAVERAPSGVTGSPPGSRFRRVSRAGAGGGDSRGVAARSPSRRAGPAARGLRATAGRGGTGGSKGSRVAASGGGPVRAGKWKRSRLRPVRSDPSGGTRVRPIVGFIAGSRDELPDQRREQRRGHQGSKEAEASQPSAVPASPASSTHCRIKLRFDSPGHRRAFEPSRETTVGYEAGKTRSHA